MAGVLFSACLEAFQAHAQGLNDETEFPGLDWEGWSDIAEKLGILDTVDAPIFRVRQAVKIALSADAATLRGDRVKFGAVEERLCDILSGGASLSQVPDTQAEELMLRPARARIVLRERRRKRGGKGSHVFYEVVFCNHPREEGTWLSAGELKRHFPEAYKDMLQDFEERLASGRLLEPSPEEAGGAVGAVLAGEHAAQPASGEQPPGQQQQGAAAQAPGAQAQQQSVQPVSGTSGGAASGGSRRLSAAGGVPLPPHRPVAPRNIPLESQPDAEPAALLGMHGQGQPPLPPSMLLAGVGRRPAAAQQQPQGPARSGQPSGALHSVPAFFRQQQAAVPPPPPQHAAVAAGSGYRVESMAPGARFMLQRPAQAALGGAAAGPPAIPAALAARPAASGAAGAAVRSPGRGLQAPYSPPSPARPPSNVPRFFQQAAQERSTASAPAVPAPAAAFPAPVPPPGYARAAGAPAPAPIPPPGYAASAGNGSAGALRLVGARLTVVPASSSRSAPVPAFFRGTGGSPAKPAAPLPPPDYPSPARAARGAAPAAVSPSGALSPAASSAAIYAAYRRKRPADVAALAPAAAGPPRPPPGWQQQQQQPEQQQHPASTVQQQQELAAPAASVQQASGAANKWPARQPPPVMAVPAASGPSGSVEVVPSAGRPPAAPEARPPPSGKRPASAAGGGGAESQQPAAKREKKGRGRAASGKAGRAAAAEEAPSAVTAAEPSAAAPDAAAAGGEAPAVAAAEEQAAPSAATAAEPAAEPSAAAPDAATEAAAGGEALAVAAAEEQAPPSGAVAAVPEAANLQQSAGDQQATASEEGPADEAELAFRQALPLIAPRLPNMAPSPAKLNPGGRLLPPDPGQQQQQQQDQEQQEQEGGAPLGLQAAGAPAAGQQPAAEAAVSAEQQTTPGEDDFYDAQEELAQESSQQQVGAAAAADAAAPGAEAGAAEGPVGPWHQLLRTQPDEVQWTAAQVEEGQGGDGAAAESSLPDTQVVGGASAEEGRLVVPDTEEQAAAGVQDVAQSPVVPVKQEPEEGAAPEGGADAGDEGHVKEEGVKEEEEEEGLDAAAAWELAARFRGCTIRGAKAAPDGVELWVQWADGERAAIPTARLHALAQDDCPGCWVLQKLNQFYESKTRGTSRSSKRRR